jgi:hypothetical protein
MTLGSPRIHTGLECDSQERLGGVDIFMDDNCAAMLKSLRLD